MERQLVNRHRATTRTKPSHPHPACPTGPGAVANIFEPLAAASINVDMIIQNVGRDKGETDVTFTVPQSDLARAQALLEDPSRRNRVQPHHHRQQDRQDQCGWGGHEKPCRGSPARCSAALSDRGINIQAISTSEIKVSVMIDEETRPNLRCAVLHTA